MQDKILDLQTITKFQFVSLSLYHNKIIISHILKNYMPVRRISYIYPIRLAARISSSGVSKPELYFSS